MGETLVITGKHNSIAACTIDLDVALFHMDFNKSQIPAIRAKYGPDVSLRMYQEEGLFTLQSNRADLPVSEIIHEFQLDPLKDYLQRNRLLQERCAADAAPRAPSPLWGAETVVLGYRYDRSWVIKRYFFQRDLEL